MGDNDGVSDSQYRRLEAQTDWETQMGRAGGATTHDGGSTAMKQGPRPGCGMRRCVGEAGSQRAARRCAASTRQATVRRMEEGGGGRGGGRFAARGGEIYKGRGGEEMWVAGDGVGERFEAGGGVGGKGEKKR